MSSLYDDCSIEELINKDLWDLNDSKDFRKPFYTDCFGIDWPEDEESDTDIDENVEDVLPIDPFQDDLEPGPEFIDWFEEYTKDYDV